MRVHGDSAPDQRKSRAGSRDHADAHPTPCKLLRPIRPQQRRADRTRQDRVRMRLDLGCPLWRRPLRRLRPSPPYLCSRLPHARSGVDISIWIPCGRRCAQVGETRLARRGTELSRTALLWGTRVGAPCRTAQVQAGSASPGSRQDALTWRHRLQGAAMPSMSGRRLRAEAPGQAVVQRSSISST